MSEGNWLEIEVEDTADQLLIVALVVALLVGTGLLGWVFLGWPLRASTPPLGFYSLGVSVGLLGFMLVDKILERVAPYFQ